MSENNITPLSPIKEMVKGTKDTTEKPSAGSGQQTEIPARPIKIFEGEIQIGPKLDPKSIKGATISSGEDIRPVTRCRPRHINILHTHALATETSHKSGISPGI